MPHRSRIVALLGLLATLICTRWPLKPDWLLTFDNANFAFALDEFNPALHKPQPPGYLLFVGLSRLIHLAVSDAVTVFFIAGLIGAAIAILAVAALAKDSAGPVAGVAAGFLLLTHPSLWAAELLNPVRVFLAAGSALVALLASRAMRPDAHWSWFASAAAVLGVASGFRPTLLVLLAPLLLYAGWKRRTTPLQWTVAIAAGAVTTAAWVVVTAASVGGIEAYLRLLSDYMDEQSETTSLLFGASLGPALRMAGRALMWSFVPCLIWMAMVPLLRKDELRAIVRENGIFLLVWTLPSLFVYTLVHSAEPGHVMPLVVPACFAGALVLSRVPRPGLAIAGSALAGAMLFLLPPKGPLVLSSVRAVRWSNRNVSEGLSLIRSLRAKAPVTVVASSSSAIAWRLLSYYQSVDPVIVLLSDPAHSGSTQQTRYWIVQRGRLAAQGSGPIPLPASGKVVWFLQKDAPPVVTEQTPVPRASAGPAFVTDAAAGKTLRLGQYQFATATAVTNAAARR